MDSLLTAGADLSTRGKSAGVASQTLSVFGTLLAGPIETNVCDLCKYCMDLDSQMPPKGKSQARSQHSKQLMAQKTAAGRHPSHFREGVTKQPVPLPNVRDLQQHKRPWGTPPSPSWRISRPIARQSASPVPPAPASSKKAPAPASSKALAPASSCASSASKLQKGASASKHTHTHTHK